MKPLLILFFILINGAIHAQSLVGKWGLTEHYVDAGDGLKLLKNSCTTLAADTIFISEDSTFKYYSYYNGKNDNGYMYGKWSLTGTKLKLYAIDYEPKTYGTTSDVAGEFSTKKGEIILYQAHCVEVRGMSHFKRKK